MYGDSFLEQNRYGNANANTPPPSTNDWKEWKKDTDLTKEGEEAPIKIMEYVKNLLIRYDFFSKNDKIHVLYFGFL